MQAVEQEHGESRFSTFIYYTWKICTCIFSHVVLVSLVVAYCILGAFTFESLEAKHEREVKEGIVYFRNNLTNDLWKITKNMWVLHQENWTTKVLKRLEDFETDLLKAMKKEGWDGSEDPSVIQWTFAGALFYSIIVITTIGYGHIAPKTHWGKVVTIFYAILGIPLMLLCLSNIGDVMAQSFRFLYWKVCCYICTRRPKKTHSKRGRSVRGTIRHSGSGRNPGRSRTASFRRSARTSQRSADSAIGLSESVMTRSSYSDPEYRYYDDPDRDLTLMSGGGSLQRNRASQHSRSSDTTLALQAPPAVQSEQDTSRVPVLFNKYAVDKEDGGGRGEQQHARHEDGGGTQFEHHRDSSKSRDPGHGFRESMSAPQTPLSPRQPPFSRYSRPGSSRLGKLREDDFDDLDFVLDYDYEEEPEDSNKPVPIWLCVFLVISYILGGAFLFSEWEKWPFLDSAYFCFITLTTIGFGDFVPAQREKDAEVSIALCSLYLLFGIALLAMSFNLVQEEVINNVKSVAKRLGIIKEDDDEDAD